MILQAVMLLVKSSWLQQKKNYSGGCCRDLDICIPTAARLTALLPTRSVPWTARPSAATHWLFQCRQEGTVLLRTYTTEYGVRTEYIHAYHHSFPLYAYVCGWRSCAGLRPQHLSPLLPHCRCSSDMDPTQEGASSNFT